MTPRSTTSLAPPPDRAAARELAHEHSALVRQMASLQRRVSEQVRTQAQQVAALEEEVMYLRAHVIVSRTCMLWGLAMAGVARPIVRRHRAPGFDPQDAMAEASGVICQTGCVGHAHPWLEADGQCRRMGVACKQVRGHGEDPS